MRATIALITVLIALASQAASQQVPISIQNRPEVVALLRTVNFPTQQTACGGAILNNIAVLTAARCFESDGPERWRFRVGSSNWNSGGTVYFVSEIVRHENWDEWAMGTDIAVVRTSGNIVFGNSVQMGSFSGPNYVVPEGQSVSTVGWGYTSMPLWNPTQYSNLRQVVLTNLNLDVCRGPYSNQGFWVNNNQLCIGFGSVTSNTVPRDRCFGEPGMPVYHGNIIVGIRSYGLSCSNDPQTPTVNTRVSGFINWIQATAVGQ